MQTREKRKRHDCPRMTNNGLGGWTECAACGGRVHLEGCTSRRDLKKDCTCERHLWLWVIGQSKGVLDSACDMLDSCCFEHFPDNVKAAILDARKRNHTKTEE